MAHEDVDDGCVLGALADASTFVGDWTCQPGVFPAFNDLFTGYVEVTGCYLPSGGAMRCLTMHLPEPH